MNLFRCLLASLVALVFTPQALASTETSASGV